MLPTLRKEAKITAPRARAWSAMETGMKYHRLPPRRSLVENTI
jgi:hypothetical protein